MLIDGLEHLIDMMKLGLGFERIGGKYARGNFGVLYFYFNYN